MNPQELRQLLPQQIQIPSSFQAMRKRRSKNVETGRDFLCECGKSYLSYSALYTHAKVKHGNKITYEQSLYSTANTSKSERPNFLDAELMEMLDGGRKQYSLALLEQFLQTVRKEMREECQKVANPKKVKINSLVFMQKSKKYWDNRELDDEPIEEEVVYVMPIDKAIGYFMVKMEAALQSEDFYLLQFFIMKIRNDFNDIHKNWRQTELSPVSEFPQAFNDIFLRIKAAKDNDFFKENPTLTAMLFYHLNWWLWTENFTTYKLKLNVEVE